MISNMSTKKPLSQPVRVSELLGSSKSSGKKSDKKIFEPIRIKDMLAGSKSASKTDSASKSTFPDSRIARQPVRRALYSKILTPKTSPSKRNKLEPVTVKVSIRKSLGKSRKSLLPPPNSIVQKHMQQVINDNSRYSTIIEERSSQIFEATNDVNHHRPTVIKSTKLRRSKEKKNVETITNNSYAIPNIVITEDDDINEPINEELEASIADKENIPPPIDETQRSSTENKSQHSDTGDLHLVGLYRSAITRMENIERELQEIKTQNTMEMNLLQKIYDLLTVKFELIPSVPIKVDGISAESKILTEFKSPTNNNNTSLIDKENIVSEKKKRRQSKELVKELRRSARLSAKYSNEKRDSFTELEAQLQINESTPQKTPINKFSILNKGQRTGSQADRPLREYLAMKASMSFLETPEPNGFRHNINLIDNESPLRNKTLRRSISTKLFDELQELYLESPPHNTKLSCE
ncbi:hypothetical protein PV327_010462 [Microctonus hyperodae]|uniref:Uncharacterized protein n=1 Tax=Microctonus hyperodae TaxID=165561 RepID=A0AA39FSL1_MICHY|nr:hypothetical protein PV327_010462 [Microctonus hyperodae]